MPNNDSPKLAEDQLSALLASAMDAIVTVDEEQRIMLFNPAAERMFQRSVEEVIGKPLDLLLPTAYHKSHRELVDRFAHTGATHRRMEAPGQLVGLRANGDVFPIEATISQVVVGGQKLMTAIVRDVSERVRMETAMIRAEKLAAAGRLAATMAHEINNPLESISNALYLTHMQPLEPDVRSYIGMAREELDRVANIVKRTLQLSSASETTGPVDFAKLVSEVRQTFSEKLRHPGIRVICDVEPGATITGNAGEIRQVLVNLIANAIDAITQGGAIAVRVRSATRGDRVGVRLLVADTGRGIPPEVRPHIFEPFYTTKGERGTGLGLWVTASVISKHQGSIRLKSCCSQERSGTCFSIFLPRETSETKLRRIQVELPEKTR